MPAFFKDQLAIVEELLREVERMEAGEKRFSETPLPGGYERELRLAGLAQRVAHAYTVIEGLLAYVARRIDRAPLAGKDWHKQLISRCAQPFDEPRRAPVISAALADDLLELCEFRHVVNIYPTCLDEARVQQNLERLIGAARAFGAECKVFAAGLSPARGRRRSRQETRPSRGSAGDYVRKKHRR